MKFFPGQRPPPPNSDLSTEEQRARDADPPIAQDRPETPSQDEAQMGNQVDVPGASTGPEMEAVLASIRRIMNDEEAAIPPSSGTAPEAAGPRIIDVTEDMLVADQTRRPSPVLADAPAEPDRSLVAPAVAAAAAASVGTLLQAVAANRLSAVTRGGPSIEDVVRAELRPMLKDWLDAHLPSLVERLVRIEIERVVGKALS